MLLPVLFFVTGLFSFLPFFNSDTRLNRESAANEDGVFRIDNSKNSSLADACLIQEEENGDSDVLFIGCNGFF